MTYLPINFGADQQTPELASAGATFTNSLAVQGTITVTRRGYWVAWFRGNTVMSSSGGLQTFNLLVNGSVVDTVTADAGGGGSATGPIGLQWTGGVLNSGDTIQIQGNHGGGGDSANGTLRAVFVPTPIYRR